MTARQGVGKSKAGMDWQRTWNLGAIDALEYPVPRESMADSHRAYSACLRLFAGWQQMVNGVKCVPVFKNGIQVKSSAGLCSIS